MEIQEIKQRLSIQEVLAHYGIEMNRNKHIHCPFHQDKTPSMRVYPETNTVYCFSGNCRLHGKSLDVIELVREKEECSKHEAIMKCKAMLGHTTSLTTSAMQQVWKSLRVSLQKHAKARAYIIGRGLDIKGLGYHSGQLYKGKLVQEAKEVGLITKEGKAWAAACVLFALRKENGQIASFYGRGLEKGHYYQTGRAGLYPHYPDQKTKKLILTESVIDAESLMQVQELRGLYAVLALYGTNGFTKEHEKALLGLEELEEVVLMLDGDEAGRKASKKYQQQLSSLLPRAKVRIVELPEGTDVNELWANHLSGALFLELLGVDKPALKKQKEPTALLGLCTKNPNNLLFEGSQARYSIKGFGSLKHLDSLKVTLVVEKQGRKYRGKVELYEQLLVEKYCRAAGQKLGVAAELLDLDISLLTDELEQYREGLVREQQQGKKLVPVLELSPKAKGEAINFLEQQDLLSRLNAQIGQTGIVGEEQTRLLLLIVASSYKCQDPLHALIQGSSGTGKTLLMRKVMAMLPEADRHIWTRISDKSLYHAGTKFKHSAIAVEDWDGLSEEVQYVVRELQSGQRLSSTITQKKPNGELDNVELLAEGPISSLMCTTKGAIYEDNMSRCLLVAVDEGAKQTQQILEYQYRKDRGVLNKQLEQQSTQKIQSFIHLLEPKEVINPYAGQIRLPDKVHKIRRLNYLFQCFVKQITWWHQYQRQEDEEGRLLTTKADLQAAIQLLFETIILKVDELDGALRQFYEQLKSYVLEQEAGEQYHFTRREVRQALNISKSRQHSYMRELLGLEYLQQVGGHSNRGYQYKILYWDDNKELRASIQAHLQQQLELL